VWACGRKLSGIGFYRGGVGHSFLIGGLTMGGLFALNYAVQLIALLARGEDAGLFLATGIGGIIYGYLYHIRLPALVPSDSVFLFVIPSALMNELNDLFAAKV
jgi:hypothetical protein